VTTEIKGVKLCIGSAICWENYMPLLRQSLYSQNINLWFAPTADARDTWASLMRTVGCEGRCFVVSANQCVKKKHLPEWISGEKKQEQAQNQSQFGESGVGRTRSQQGSSSGRRRSTITKTQEGHEICLPIPEGHSTTTDGDSSAIDSSPLPTEEEALGPKQQPFSQPQSSSTNGEEYVSRGGSMIVSPLGEILAGPLWEEEDELLVTEVDFEDCERGRLDFDSAGSYSRMDSFKLSVEGLDMNPPAM
jgi:nitrilase